MAKIPLVPFERPVPQAFIRNEIKTTKAQKDKTVVSTKKTPAKPAKAAKAKFSASNSEDISSKAEALQTLWKIMSKSDPDGELFVNDKGLIQLQGDGAPTRTPKALGFTAEETAMIAPFGIYDSDSPDDPATARGVIFTGYQFLEMAYELGRRDEQENVTGAMVAATDDDDEGDAEADVEEDIDDIDEDDLDEVVDGAEDDKEDDEDFDDDEAGEQDG